MRRIAGIASMVVGVPNLIIGIALTLSGIAAVIGLAVIGIGLLFAEPSDDICGPLLVVLLIIIVVIGLILAVIFTIIAAIFAVGVAGQAIGGIHGFRGVRYTRTIILTIIGSIVSLLGGIGILFIGLSLDDPDPGVRIGAILWGAFDIFAFFVTMTSFFIYIKTRETFREPPRKERKRKEVQGKGHRK